MASNQNKATVRVTLTVSVAVSRAWGTFTLDTLFDECNREGCRKVATALKGTGIGQLRPTIASSSCPWWSTRSRELSGGRSGATFL